MANDPLVGETKRGFDFLKEIFERGKILRLGVPKLLKSNDGNYYSIEVAGPASRWQLCLSRENLDDLPGTSEHGVSAIALVQVLESRLQTPDPYLFLTATGRVVGIRPLWPYQVSVGYVDHSVWVEVTDAEAGIGLKVHVVSDHRYEYQTNPYQRNEHLVNAMRFAVDTGDIEPTNKSALNEIKVAGDHVAPQSLTPDQFVQTKVWKLGHVVAPKPHTPVWVADPWDASYFQISTLDMVKRGAILNAQGKIELRTEDEFARVGPVMLAQVGPDKQAPLQPIPSDEFRTALGSYSRLDILGEGGAGRVLRVKDSDGTEFALKYLKAESATTLKSKRFRNEMSFSSYPNNPHIIRVIDWGLAIVDGAEAPFYVMRVYPMTLMDVIGKKLRPHRLLDIFDQILDGVEAAHAQGVWHRDLKPQNILYDPDGDTAVVSDFGIAHFTEPLLHTEVKTGKLDGRGNFKYAAPEQRANGVVDHRADIYTLGIILYEMLTGQFLQGTNHSKIGASRPELSYIDPIVDRMADQSPDRRFQSIAEVRAALRQGRGAESPGASRSNSQKATSSESQPAPG